MKGQGLQRGKVKGLPGILPAAWVKRVSLSCITKDKQAERGRQIKIE